jgi:tetratricopeptide (TPR) repeat protein
LAGIEEGASAPQWFVESVQTVQKILSTADRSQDDMAYAAHLCEQMLQFDRLNVPIIFLLGTVYMQANKTGVAECMLELCTHLDPKFAEAYNNLGFIAQIQGRWDEAQSNFERCLDLQPDNIEALSNYGSMFVNAGEPQKAIDIAQRVLAQQPDNADAAWNAALAYLELGDWKEGWSLYRKGLDLSLVSSTQRKRRYKDLPYWDGKTVQKVVVYGEQGVGDEIMGVSMINDLIAFLGVENIILEAHPRLYGAYRRSFPGLTVYGTRKVEGIPVWHKWDKPDAKIPLLGLGEYLRSTDEHFRAARKPYLSVVPSYVERFKHLLTMKKPVVGISWNGGSMQTRAMSRSMALHDFHENIIEPFKDRIQFVSLQYDPSDNPGFWDKPLSRYRKDTGIDLIHYGEVVNNLDICYGGLIHCLDLVISVNTSLVHACGAYGVECLTLTPKDVAWRYGSSGSHMPWYGTHVEVTRQTERGDWTVPVQRAHERMERLLSE